MNLLITLLALALLSSVHSQCQLQCDPDTSVGCSQASFEDIEELNAHPITIDGKTLDWAQIVGEGGEICNCLDGWTGQTCETPFEECEDGVHRCYHGGVCLPALYGPSGIEQRLCNCELAIDGNGNHYRGKYCQETSTNTCANSDDVFCLNGGTCNVDFP